LRTRSQLLRWKGGKTPGRRKKRNQANREGEREKLQRGGSEKRRYFERKKKHKNK